MQNKWKTLLEYAQDTKQIQIDWTICNSSLKMRFDERSFEAVVTLRSCFNEQQQLDHGRDYNLKTMRSQGPDSREYFPLPSSLEILYTRGAYRGGCIELHDESNLYRNFLMSVYTRNVDIKRLV